MARLTYAEIIERDQRYKILADLGLRLDLADTPKLMPRLVDLVALARLSDWLIRQVTHGKYSYCEIAIAHDDGLYSCYSNS
ncbi:hypothetical protein QG098_01285, partial [Kingella kingae]|nr:hypothetical protein [Kingella kingae]MDK4659610.1 hypothetical protein [Kingella kingae]MDK4667513.1 hypothetical protein [Kingella kingae]MDK4685966.1 hypothetical protein [Kingella kingae]